MTYPFPPRIPGPDITEDGVPGQASISPPMGPAAERIAAARVREQEQLAAEAAHPDNEDGLPGAGRSKTGHYTGR